MSLCATMLENRKFRLKKQLKIVSRPFINLNSSYFRIHFIEKTHKIYKIYLMMENIIDYIFIRFSHENSSFFFRGGGGGAEMANQTTAQADSALFSRSYLLTFDTFFMSVQIVYAKNWQDYTFLIIENEIDFFVKVTRFLRKKRQNECLSAFLVKSDERVTRGFHSFGLKKLGGGEGRENYCFSQ